jgi:hypothetical protein
VCEALLVALGRHGLPDQILTDNGKVFTGRFGPAGSSAEVLFDGLAQLAAPVVPGGPSSTVGTYSNSWSPPSNVRLSTRSSLTSGYPS